MPNSRRNEVKIGRKNKLKIFQFLYCGMRNYPYLCICFWTPSVPVMGKEPNQRIDQMVGVESKLLRVNLVKLVGIPEGEQEEPQKDNRADLLRSTTA